MLWNKYPTHLDDFTLGSAYESLQGDLPAKIPVLVWLLENPVSPVSLPGSIDLFGHDCIHLLLKKGFRSADEAYVVGFTMGNDPMTNWLHIAILKFASYFLYPCKYRFTYSDLKIFDLGIRMGRRAKIKNLNKYDWCKWHDRKLRDIRSQIELTLPC
jgi:hypothetical protein